MQEEYDNSFSSAEDYLLHFRSRDFEQKLSKKQAQVKQQYGIFSPRYKNPSLNQFSGSDKTCRCQHYDIRKDFEIKSIKKDLNLLRNMFLDKMERVMQFEQIFQQAMDQLGEEMDRLDERHRRFDYLEERVLEILDLRQTSGTYYNYSSAFPTKTAPMPRSPADFSFSNNEGDDTTTFSFGEIDENVVIGNTAQTGDSEEFEAFLESQNIKLIDESPNFIDQEKAECQRIDIPYMFYPSKTGCESTKDFPILIGDIIAERFRIDCIIAQTNFSTVIDCFDVTLKRQVCLKVINNEKEIFDQGLDEIKIMRLLAKDTNQSQHLIKLLDYFYFREHLFIVTELLGENLFMIMQMGCPGQSLLVSNLKTITQQALQALDYLHNNQIIHADLKPENILSLRQIRKSVNIPQSIAIKIADFGSSCFFNDDLTTYIQSKAYRAPEVILGSSYNCKIDVWSLGCILAEIITGDPILDWDTIPEFLAKLKYIIGDLPKEGKLLQLYINDNETLINQIDIGSCKSLKQIASHDPLLLDFLSQLLSVDPTKRPFASEALSHAWLN